MNKIVVFASGTGSNFEAIVHACNAGVIPATVASLFVNKKCPSIQIANSLKVPVVHLYSFPKFNQAKREEYDTLLAEAVNEINPDLIVLAGWMHILSEKFFETTSIPVVNLHPALPGKFPGKDAVSDAWEAYQECKTDHTGVMVHYAIPEIDAGKTIESLKVEIFPTDTKETLHTRIKTLEKSVLISGICKHFAQTNKTMGDNSSVGKKIVTGKVRNVYDIGYGFLAIECTDRLSAFDIHRCNIDGKGKLLTSMAAKWFKKTNHVAKNHFVASDGNCMFVYKTRPIKLEVIVRGYITGSCWTAYTKGRRKWGTTCLPNNLKEYQKLPEPILTPTTKADPGQHDEPIEPDEIVSKGYCTSQQWSEIQEKALELFEYASMVCESKGITLVDTKLEFGVLPNGDILVIDEIFTPDSSRFWYKGDPKLKLDKDTIRRYIQKNNLVDTPNAVIPEEVKKDLYVNYLEPYSYLFQCLPSDGNSQTLKDKIEDFFKNQIPQKVYIVSGSVKDQPHIDKIQTELRKVGVYSTVMFASAHKEAEKLNGYLEEIKEYSKCGKTIVVTVAGKSNALSGFVAGNTKLPVIGCPPFSDTADMMVNLHSTVQMPSNVPVMTILSPGNVALAIQRIFELFP